MAETVKLGWIKSQFDTNYYIKLNGTSTALVIDRTQQDFVLVISPTQYGAYGLIATRSLSHAVKATDNATTDSRARRLEVVTMPSGVAAGTPLPSPLNKKLLFSIDRVGGLFKIKSKYLSTSTEYVFDLSGHDIIAYPDHGGNTQRWTFESQQPSTAGKKYCTKSTTIKKPMGTEVSVVSPQDQGVSDASPDIVDGKWVPVVLGGNGIVIAGARDPTGGKCYKFKMQQVSGSFKKDRCELCRIFTRLSDLSSTSVTEIANLTTCKYIYRLSSPETRCGAQGVRK